MKCRSKPVGGKKIDFAQRKLIGEMMSKDDNLGYEIIAKGDLVMLRPIVVTDRAHWDRWQTQGEWLNLMHYGMLQEEWEKMR